MSLTHPAYAGQAIRVNGEWEFYPFVFLDPKDVLNRPAPGSYPTVPSSWNTYLSDAGDGIGYGSYRLVAAVSPGRAYGIYGGEMGVATSIYIDGHLIARSGRPSESATQEVPETLPMEGTFIPQGETSEIIIHISNFDYRKGGFWNALYLGDAEGIRRFVRMQRFRDMFLAGAFLISAFYHLILFLVIRRDRVLPLFSLLSLIITLRLLSTNQRLLVDLFPVLHFPAYFRVEIGSWLLAMPVGLHFVYCLFPRHIPRRIHQFAYLAAGALGVTLFLSIHTISAMVPISQFILMGLGLTTLVYIIIAAIRGGPGTILFLIASTVFLAAVGNDILHTNEIVQTSQVAPLGLLVFIIAQSYLIAKLYARNQAEREANESARKIELEELVNSRTADLKKANAARTNFFANISHELRTPVNAIVNISDLISRVDINPEEFDTYVDLLRRSGLLLKDLINDIIDFSKLDSARFDLVLEAFPIRKAVVEAIEMLDGMANVKQLLMVQNIDTGCAAEHHVAGDRMRFTQVILNLVANAIKYTNTGRVDISMTCSQPSPAELEVYFAVRDTGPGITLEKQKNLFQPFQSGGGQRPIQSESGGLGLSIVSMLLQKMGSRIELRSKPGNGSLFYFNIRFSLVCPIQSRPEPDYIAGAEITGPVLLVDDNDVNRLLGERMLRVLNFACDTVASGAEALAALEAGHYQIVLLDIMMPDIDGLEVARLIRDNPNIDSHIPLIACTAATMDENQADYMAGGFSGVLAKPYNLTGMRTAINRAIAHSAAMRGA